MAFAAMLCCAIAAQGHAAAVGIDALLRPSKVAAREAEEVTSAPSMQIATASPLPVITDFFTYIGEDYYGSAELRQRLYVPIDSADYGKPDTGTRFQASSAPGSSRGCCPSKPARSTVLSSNIATFFY